MIALRVARHAANLTQRDLAEWIGVHEQTVIDWERGKCLPSRESAAALKLALGVDVAWRARGRPRKSAAPAPEP